MTSNVIRVRPIRSAKDHDAAVARITELMGSAPGTPAGDELDVLATLVDAWEAKHQPIDPPEPMAAIQFRMEQMGLSRRDLESMLGSRARVSEIFSGRRRLSIEMIRRVRAGLGISADLLIDSSSQPQHRMSHKSGGNSRHTSSARDRRSARSEKDAPRHAAVAR